MLLLDFSPSKSSAPSVPISVSSLNTKLLAFWKSLLSHSAGFVALACAALSIVAVCIATTDKIIIGPFSVPDEYQERGYTSEAVSNSVVQFIHGNESTVTLTQSFDLVPGNGAASPGGVDELENIAEHVDGKHVVSSFDQSSIPDINIPLTSFSLDAMIGLLRETVGRRPTRIAGEIVAVKEADSSNGDADLQHAQVLVRYKIEYPEPSSSFLGYHWWSRRRTTITDTLTANGAEDVVRKLALVTADGLERRTLVNQDDKSRMERFLRRGNTYFGLGDYGRAERMYLRANDFQESGHAFLCLGVIQEHKGNFDEAEEYYSDATNTEHASSDDDANWALLYWGNLLLRERRLDDARSKYRLVTEAPHKIQALLVQAAAFHNIGFIDLLQHKPQQAGLAFKYAKDLAELLRSESQTCVSNAGVNSACENLQSQSSNEAESFLNIELANQLLARIHYGRAQLLSIQEPAERAKLKSEYFAAIQSHSAYSRPHYRLASIYHSEKNYKKELDELQKTIQLEPTFEPAYTDWKRLVDQWKSLPAKQKSDKPRRKALAGAYKNWGDMVARAGNPDEAYEKYCQASALNAAYKPLCAQPLDDGH